MIRKLARAELARFRLSLKQARRLVGRLSLTSKMPGFSYSIPAKACVTGQHLAKLVGTVCSRCYALKGRYQFRVVMKAQLKKLRAIRSPGWVDAMVLLIEHDCPRRSRFFRWFDSGDLQSVEHLSQIVQIALRLPGYRFWLPTREFGFVETFLEQGGEVPENLTIRLSTTFINSFPHVSRLRELPKSMVYSGKAPEGVWVCPAHLHFNICDECRACWDKTVEIVAYPLH